MADIYNGYQFLTPIVGESNYIETLKQLYNHEQSFKQGNSAFVDVTLIHENNNPYDNQAVLVMSPLGPIGYLSRQIAREYRQDYSQPFLTVRAKIFSRDNTMYGVWVDLDYEEE